MTVSEKTHHHEEDAAAIFAAASSLWKTCHAHASSDRGLNLGKSYEGMDQLMREVMRIGRLFELWACQHVDFNELEETWPYLLEENFGAVCMRVISPTNLFEFDETDCLRVALLLNLPLSPDDHLPIPVNLHAPNPVKTSPFHSFRIQTVRTRNDDGDVEPFTICDDPFDDQCSPPFVALYGVTAEGWLEHIADRPTCSEALKLAEKLVPGVRFHPAPLSGLPNLKQPSVIGP